MDLSNPELEEIKAYHKKKQEDLKKKYDEFVENLEEIKQSMKNENENEYEYEDEVDEYEEEDLQEGKYIFIF
jgi:hypothetical protein